MSETTAGISDISTRPPDNLPPNATVSPETSKELSAKQRVIDAQRKGVDLIKNKQSSGFFDTGDKVGVKEDVETVLMQEKQEHGKLDSAGLKAFFNVTSAIGPEAAEIEKAAAENMQVKVGDRMLNLNDWRTELEAARKPTDGTPPDQQKIQELENGDFAYEFPKEEPGGEKPDAGILIEQKLKDLENKKDKSEDEKKLLVMLRLAKRANGKMSAIVKDRALRYLNILDSESGAGKILEGMAEETKQARGSLNDLLRNNGWNEEKIKGFNTALDNGGIDSLISQGELPKVIGFEDALFGKDGQEKDMSEEELRKLLDPENKRDWSKLGNLFGILFALMFVGDISKQLLPDEQQR